MGRIDFNNIYPTVPKILSFQRVINKSIISELFRILLLLLNFGKLVHVCKFSAYLCVDQRPL